MPPSEKQLATMESLSDSIQANWMKIGEEYANKTEADVHAIVHRKGITKQLRTCFQDYTSLESQRAVGFLMKLNAGYVAIWRKRWQAISDARDAERDENERVIAECLTWEQVTEWMQRPLLFSFVPCHFEFVKKLGKVSYWKRREKTRHLYQHRTAEDKHKQWGLDAAGYTFQMAWQPVNEPGYDGTLWEVIPRLQDVCQ